MTIFSRYVLIFAKRIEVQRVQMVLISRLHEIKCVDAIMHQGGNQGETRPTATLTTNTRKRYKYFSQDHKPPRYLVYGKKCDKCGKLNHFREVCKSSKSGVVHTLEKEAEHEQEPSIKMVNINSVRFNSNQSAIVAKLKTSS